MALNRYQVEDRAAWAIMDKNRGLVLRGGVGWAVLTLRDFIRGDYVFLGSNGLVLYESEAGAKRAIKVRTIRKGSYSVLGYLEKEYGKGHYVRDILEPVRVRVMVSQEPEPIRA